MDPHRAAAVECLLDGVAELHGAQHVVLVDQGAAAVAYGRDEAGQQGVFGHAGVGRLDRLRLRIGGAGLPQPRRTAPILEGGLGAVDQQAMDMRLDAAEVRRQLADGSVR